MDVFLRIILIAFLGAVAAAATLLSFRNAAVFSYRQRVSEAVQDAAEKNVQAGMPWKWRYQELEKVSYYAMVLKFWRSFDSFYRSNPARPNQ